MYEIGSEINVYVDVPFDFEDDSESEREGVAEELEEEWEEEPDNGGEEPHDGGAEETDGDGEVDADVSDPDYSGSGSETDKTSGLDDSSDDDMDEDGYQPRNDEVGNQPRNDEGRNEPRQKGLINSFDRLLPNVEHRYCMRHLYDNFQKTYKGKEYKDLMWGAASAYTNQVSFEKMAHIRSLSEEAHQWLVDQEPEHWASATGWSTIAERVWTENNYTSWHTRVLQLKSK
ncbi:hypothetical protein Vadar_022646 [Vaccinium darrowii]|uniref:Uncharacterized protein n=1 Tax=Vaccinium darrowii TaxID=229202 RepID=A0ACB7YP10_9ERIC|nr:hypothetical protein Vadar_022646 [Vaccinium darrowii]